MFFRQVFEPRLAQYAYIIGCQRTGEAIVIDPMRDIDRYIDIAADEDLTIVAATETHIHADFLSGAREFAERGIRIYLSHEGGNGWEYGWTEAGDYSVELVKNGDTFKIGYIGFEVLHTPGHTPEHISFMITDHGGGADAPMGIASGDFVFVGDLGRPDLLETAAGEVGAMRPAAERLYSSAQGFLELPDYLQVWPGHGAGSACGKALGAVPETTVGYERRFSPALHFVQKSEDAFVDFILDGQPEPPLYFARMKKWNRDGPPVLGAFPQPRRVSSEELQTYAGTSGPTVVDTRTDRQAFMAGHLPGSLYAPLDNTFPTITGSFINEDADIILIADEAELDQAIVDLIRIGLDRVVGWAPPEALASVTTQEIEVATTADIDALVSAKSGTVLDVRRKTEYDEGHVPGAINVAHTQLRARLDEVPADTPLLVHCRSGARAAAAASFLQRNGREVVYVDGLISDWHARGATAPNTVHS